MTFRPVKQKAVSVDALTGVYVCVCVGRVKQRSTEGLEAARTELEVREKVGEELHGVQIWLQAAHGLLTEVEQSSNTEELQVRHLSHTLQGQDMERLLRSFILWFLPRKTKLWFVFVLST